VSLTALHLGNLHTYEQVLVALIAFGPFVILGAVVHVVRKRDLAAEGEGEPPKEG
jgi:hypothetical protein